MAVTRRRADPLDLFRALRVVDAEDVVLRCGVCPRKLATLSVADGDLTAAMGGTSTVGNILGATQGDPISGERVTYLCSKRCGRGGRRTAYTYRAEVILSAWLRAASVGRSELVAGVDL